VVICLKQGADCLHMVRLMPLHPKTLSSLASFKSRLVLPFWYQLTEVVLGKRPLKGSSSGSNVLPKLIQSSHLSNVHRILKNSNYILVMVTVTC